jgi:MFS family permease
VRRDPWGVSVFLLKLTAGMSAATANIHAYVADCTDPARRSRVFSIYLGFVYIGVAIGPAFGSLLIRQTGDMLAVFYFAFANHLAFAFMIWFVVPESLAPTQLSRAKAAYKEIKAQARRGVGGVLTILVSFVAPLKLFVPVTVSTSDNPLKRRKDWNLTLLAAAYGFVVMLVVSELRNCAGSGYWVYPMTGVICVQISIR